ncbi:hypothetical protein AQUCO_04900204v1 [Aquilegia coerulea]|uniref:SMP domain-containing protein n=1 Tax=Aquilegia coerulea TaxID=218851 RepID=A0A2G5CKQ5_AQUCA|nr:hypothetical protein AQUCO_04900204v1 [Aquilegia coerulea]
MSQQQPRRPQTDQKPIKYGDFFDVSDEHASKPIAPRDAAKMQSTETQVLGRTQKDGPAAKLQSAADKNERIGLVGHTDVTDLTCAKGLDVATANISGSCVVTESVAGQTIGKHPQGQGPVTIGHALEAASIRVGDRPVDQSDVAAIEEAEMRATQRNVVPPGGVGEEAQWAAAHNAGLSREEDKTKLSDVLMDASEMMPRDKVVTPEDAEAVRNAEKSHNPKMTNYSGGVADMVTAAANINQRST